MANQKALASRQGLFGCYGCAQYWKISAILRAFRDMLHIFQFCMMRCLSAKGNFLLCVQAIFPGQGTDLAFVCPYLPLKRPVFDFWPLSGIFIPKGKRNASERLLWGKKAYASQWTKVHCFLYIQAVCSGRGTTLAFVCPYLPLKRPVFDF